MPPLGFWPKAAESFNSPLLRARNSATAALSGSPPLVADLPDSPTSPPASKMDAQAPAAEQLLTVTDLPTTSSSSLDTSRHTEGRAGTSQQTMSKPLRHAKSTSATSAGTEGNSGMLEILARLERTTQHLQTAAASNAFVAKHPLLLSSPPQMLLCLGLLCLALGQANLVWSMLKWLLSVSNISTLIGLACLVLAASSSLNRVYTMFAMQVDAIVLAIPKLPNMAEEISEMLVQIKLMRQDLQLMRSKVSWLPGGQY